DGFGEQRVRGPGRDERRLDVERVLLQMLLEAAERHARLHEPLQHADVVARPDVAGPAEDDRAGQPVAAEEELAVRRPVGPDARRRVRSVVVPGAEGGTSRWQTSTMLMMRLPR